MVHIIQYSNKILTCVHTDIICQFRILRAGTSADYLYGGSLKKNHKTDIYTLFRIYSNKGNKSRQKSNNIPATFDNMLNSRIELQLYFIAFHMRV